MHWSLKNTALFLWPHGIIALQILIGKSNLKISVPEFLFKDSLREIIFVEVWLRKARS